MQLFRSLILENGFFSICKYLDKRLIDGNRRTATVNDPKERKYGDPTSELTEREVFLAS